MPAVMEANGSGAASVVGGPRHDSRARTLRQRAPRAYDPCRFRVHPREACSHGEQALPVLDDQTRFAPRIEALCLVFDYIWLRGKAFSNARQFKVETKIEAIAMQT